MGEICPFSVRVFCPTTAPCSARFLCIFEKCWVIVWWLHTGKSLYISFCHVPVIPGAGHLYWVVILVLIVFSILLKKVFHVIQEVTSFRGGITFIVWISLVFLTALKSFSFSWVRPCPWIILTSLAFSVVCLCLVFFFSLSGFLLRKHRKHVVGHSALSGAEWGGCLLCPALAVTEKSCSALPIHFASLEMLSLVIAGLRVP